MLEEINFNELCHLLLDASRKAFRELQESHLDETFYAFGLYYSKHAQFVYATASSEESHLRKRNLTEEERDHQTLRWFYQRWNLREWPYFIYGHQYFLDSSRWISATCRRARSSPDVLIFWTNIDYQIEQICLRVLKTLDEEGIFGEGLARENVVLTFVIEDEYLLPDRDEVERVRLLNPASTYVRWRIEKEMSDHAAAFLERDQEEPWEER